MTAIALRACREILRRLWNDGTPDPWIIPAYCGRARCGATYCAETDPRSGVYAGMVPVRIMNDVTVALTQDVGSPADPRQRYHAAFDNPAMTLHIIGEDLLTLDGIAETVLKNVDRRTHIDTAFGTVNGIRVMPPVRTVRSDRPRYDIQLSIEMEMVR